MKTAKAAGAGNIPQNMKAVVKYDNVAGATELREVPVPDIGSGDVLVRVAYIGVCGTDPHMHKNLVSFKINVPVTFGHEFSGTIEKVGSEVKGYSVGDRVTAETHADYCGECELCRTNNYHLCRERKGFGFRMNGAFARYVRVPARILHKLPEHVGLREACLTEPLCVAYKSVVCNSRIFPGDTVAVIGPGPIGLLCVKMAQICGASEIITVGIAGDEGRLKMSLEYGATAVINSGIEDAAARIKAICGRHGIHGGTRSNGGTDSGSYGSTGSNGGTGSGSYGSGSYGADLVIDAAGDSSALALSMDVVRPAGQITKIGWGPDPIGFSLDPLIAKSITLKGHFSHTWDVWEKCLILMAKGQADLKPLITHELPINQWEKAFELVEKREAMKVVLVPVD